jgi:DNA-binding transcriptional LysR family regulator
MKQTALISDRVKLQHLKVVRAVAQWGSMAKAAKHLAISQPVVSKVVADLEDLLDVRLFDRSPQGVEPTLYGRALLKRSVSIFDDIKTGIDEIRFLSDPTVGELRVGCTEPLLAGLVTATMERLWEQHPNIALRTVQGDSATLINRELLERRIEIAVLPMQQDLLRSDIEVTTLYHDFWHVVVGVKSPWARRRKVTLEELVNEPWCATPLDTAIGSLLIEPFHASGLAAPRLTVASVMSPQLVVRLLESGRLVAVMADSLLNFFFAKQFPIKTLPVELPIKPFAIALATVKNRTISPVAQRFIDCVREIAVKLEAQRPTLAKEWIARHS